MQLQADVAKSFAHALWNTNCNACFSPIALNDCDMVQWSIDGGAVSGMTNGLQSFCHTFTSAGIHVVTMSVTRKKSDGTICAQASISKTVNVVCGPIPVCTSSAFDNPTFSEGAIEGGLNSGGASAGWSDTWGDPHESTQIDGSLDGWTMVLTGNLDTADVLSSTESMCLKKGVGTVMLRAWGDPHENIHDRHLALFFNQGDSYVYNVFNAASCFRIANLDVTAYDTSWFDLEIPYDLSGWSAFDSCGDAPHGVLVKPIVLVATCFGSNQGGEETKMDIAIDHLCFGSPVVAVKTPAASLPLRIFPNPNPGTFNVELPGPATDGLLFRIVGLTGQHLREQPTKAGNTLQTVQAGDLPAGLYFLQVVSEGKVLGVEKFVKQ